MKHIIHRSDPIVAIVLLVVIAVAYFSAPKPSTVIAQDPKEQNTTHQISEQGNLVFEKSFHDFGSTVEGSILKHTFTFKNTGAGPVKILSTASTCGCTTATAALREYAPGESGTMEVVVDTVGKKGIIVKTVSLTLENNKSPIAEISLSMNLTPPPHPMKEPLVNLNTDARCKSCHLESGKGQMGIFLYHRVCAMCHGKKGSGASARALNDAQWQNGISDEYLRDKIKKGWPEAHMPSFVEGVSPALSEEQVESLVKYVRQISTDGR